MVSATAPTGAVGEVYDVIVVGGGPAGTTTASLVAEKGYDVLLLEREGEPQFQIGESLVPATYWTLQRLGMVEKLKASASPKKYSVQFFGRSGKASKPFYFFENDPHESSMTWQVLRSDFDRMMLDTAREKGVRVHRSPDYAGRDDLFRKLPSLLKRVCRRDPQTHVFALVDYHPRDRRWSDRESMCETIRQMVSAELRDRLHVHLAVHEIEAWILACPHGLQHTLGLQRTTRGEIESYCVDRRATQ